jgi:hypothetical protein
MYEASLSGCHWLQIDRLAGVMNPLWSWKRCEDDEYEVAVFWLYLSW